MPIFVVDLLKGFGLGIEGKHTCHFMDLLKGFGLEIEGKHKPMSFCEFVEGI